MDDARDKRQTVRRTKSNWTDEMAEWTFSSSNLITDRFLSEERKATIPRFCNFRTRRSDFFSKTFCLFIWTSRSSFSLSLSLKKKTTTSDRLFSFPALRFSKHSCSIISLFRVQKREESRSRFRFAPDQKSLQTGAEQRDSQLGNKRSTVVSV